MAFSTAGINSVSRTLSWQAITSVARPSAVAAPPMSFFIWRMPSAPLMLRPPLSKHTPLPTSVSFGAFGSPQLISISRGAWAAARPTAWIAGKPAFSSASPTVCLKRAPWALATACTAAASSAGPMSSAGVLTRSRVWATTPASSTPWRAASLGASSSSDASRRGVL